MKNAVPPAVLILNALYPAPAHSAESIRVLSTMHRSPPGLFNIFRTQEACLFVVQAAQWFWCAQAAGMAAATIAKEDHGRHQG